MRILHLLFDDYPYVPDWGYQENKLSFYQSINNDVYIITGKYVPTILSEFLKVKKLKDYEEVRIPQHKIIKIFRLECLFKNSFIGKKIKKYKKLYKTIKLIHPDVIFIHDLHSVSLFTVKKYLKNNKNVICNADVHTNYVNSCSNFLSKFMHRIFYRTIIQRNINAINKIYYLNDNSKKFIKNMYGIKENEEYELKMLPLGGEITDEQSINKEQKDYKIKNNLKEKDLIFLHTGKFNSKKKTIELLKSFSNVNDDRFKLLLIGKPCNDIKKDFFELIKNDNRICYLGWKDNAEMMKYLKICDIYLQPGSPSVTAHEAMCKKCFVLLSNEGNFYNSFVKNDEAYYINNISQLYDFFYKISKNQININKYKNKGYDLAKKLFDYKVQSELIIK